MRPDDSSRNGIWSVFITAVLVMFAASLIFGIFLHERLSQIIRQQMRANAMDVARISAQMIDADAFVRLRPGDEETEDYKRVHTVLTQVLNNSDIEFLYTIAINDADEIVFVVDSDPEEPGAIGERYEGSGAAREALAGEAAADGIPYRDRWGMHFSAYAPIRRGETTVGATAVDLEYEEVLRELHRVTLLVGFLCGAFFFMSTVLMLYMTKQLERYIVRTQRAEKDARDNERAMNAFYARLPRAGAAGTADMARMTETERTADAAGTADVAGTAEQPAGTAEAAGTADAAEPADTLAARYEKAGLHYREAIRLLATEDLLEKTARQFYEDIEKNADEIERLLREGDIENYTIRVHALKSGARMIGAAELSEQAKRLEAMGNNTKEAAD